MTTTDLLAVYTAAKHALLAMQTPNNQEAVQASLQRLEKAINDVENDLEDV